MIPNQGSYTASTDPANGNVSSAYGGFEERTFNLQDYLRRYLRYWYLFPLCFGLSLSAAYYYLLITPPVYLATTTLLLKDGQKGGGSGQGEILPEINQFNGSKLLENEVKILQSRPLMYQVVNDLNLSIQYVAKDGIRDKDLYKDSPIVFEPKVLTDYAIYEPLMIHLEGDNQFRINNEKQLLTYGHTYRNKWGEFVVRKGSATAGFREVTVVFHDPADLAGSMQGQLSVTPPKDNSTVLTLAFSDVSVQRGKDVLNKLLDVYIQSTLNEKNREASNTLKFIEDRLNLITNELGSVERNVEYFKRTQGLTDISAESQQFLQNINTNDSKLNEVNVQISVLESIEKYIKSSMDDGAVAPASYLISDPMLGTLLNRFNELQMQRQRYSQTITADNPLLVTVDNQLLNVKRAIRENIQNLRRGLDLSRQNLESVNTKFTAGLRSIPQKEREYVGIKRQQSIKESLYLYLLQKREETALAYASTVTDSRLVDAPVGFGPISPKSSSIWMGAVGAGFVIPLLLINLLLMLNNTVQSREEIEQIGRVALLGELGILKKANSNQSVIKLTSRSAVAEQFRALRTNLQYLGDGSCRAIMITSSIGGEGKSFVGINLAASLAYFDKRVVLVGMDLRNPSLQERLQVPNDLGMTNYLVGKTDISDIIQSTKVHPLLDVITSGPIPPNPSELLGNGRLPQLFADLRQRYDYILIDTPPLGLVTDSALIAEHVDATLYLVRYNLTRRDHLQNISMLSRTRRFPNLSVIFNGVNYGHRYDFYYYNENEDQAQGWKHKLQQLVGAS